MRNLHDIPASEWRGKTVLLRSGLNVPITDAGTITEDLRVRRALSSILLLKNAGARVVVIAYIGREKEATLSPIVKRLQRDIPHVQHIDSALSGADARIAILSLHDGDVLLVETERFENKETKNDTDYAALVATLGDFYVGDAFPDAHRATASIAGVPKNLPHCAGIALADEVHQLQLAYNPHQPSLAIIAGSKFETKEPLIRVLMQKYTDVFVGGALGNDLLKARGYPVGASVISDGMVPQDVAENPHVLAPVDVIVERAGAAVTSDLAGVLPTDVIVDVGPLTSALLATKVGLAQFIVWNGPLGWYEKGYTTGSRALATVIAATKTQSVIGGGDTVAAIETPTFNPEHEFTFVSAGGGAMLEFLLDGTLPGIAALE